MFTYRKAAAMLLFFDIDGTLVSFENEIREKTVEAVRAARANGHKCFINSGRSRAFIQNKELLDIGFDGIISACGCRIEYDGNVIFNHIIPLEDAERAVATLRKYHIKAMHEGPEYIYLTRSDFSGDFAESKLFREVSPAFRDTDEYWGKWELQKFLCFSEIPKNIQDKCFGEISDILNIIVHSDTFTELVPIGFDKGFAIRMICDLLGEDIKNTFAFGDGINDKEMLITAGVGIGMGGMRPSLIPDTDYITAPIEEDGIWKAMKHFELI